MVIREGSAAKQLVCYYTLTPKGTENKTQDDQEQILRQFLSAHLPHYMIPNLFLRLDTMPLNVSGKMTVLLKQQALKQQAQTTAETTTSATTHSTHTAHEDRQTLSRTSTVCPCAGQATGCHRGRLF